MNDLQNLQESGSFSDLELNFARFIKRLDPDCGHEVLLAAALTMLATAQGNVCLSLEHPTSPLPVGDEARHPLIPAPAPWRETLLRSRVVGEPGQFYPLILDQANRLYLYRYWDYEHRLATALLQRAGAGRNPVELERLAQGLHNLFPRRENQEQTDWQKVAAAAAILNNICLISGGPGSGKTYTVMRLLVLLQEMAAPGSLRIGLAAPTGKAAVRLQESIKTGLNNLRLAEPILEQIPTEACTIHRLLGFRSGSPYFKYDRDNPLPLDVLIVDEASMVDLALMCKLMEALPEKSRLILLGDKDQLASVEAGSVLGDICAEIEGNLFSPEFNAVLRKVGALPPEKTHEAATGVLADSIILLSTSHRFASSGGIGLLARAVNLGQAEEATACFSQAPEEIRFLQRDERAGQNTLAPLIPIISAGYGQYLQATTPAEAFASFNRFRLLCPHRHDRFGVIAMNLWVENLLAEHGLIKPNTIWYQGRPVIMSRNNYALRLYNGDIGITMPDQEGRPMVHFSLPDGSLRALAPSRLPAHETAWAITVHKSQGSEFERLLLLLPEKISPILTRELLYTGITRARKKIDIFGDETLFKTAITRRIKRHSGLEELLWRGNK